MSDGGYDLLCASFESRVSIYVNIFLIMKMPFDIDTAIVFFFVLLNVGVGLWYARGVKTVRNYAVGDKQFLTWVITLTIVATWLSASSFAAMIQQMYQWGFMSLFICIGRGFALCFMGFFVTLRVGKFLEYLSVAETMGSIYGKGVRRIIALISIFGCVTMVAMQLDVCATYLTLFLGYDKYVAMACITFFLVLYTSIWRHTICDLY